MPFGLVADIDDDLILSDGHDPPFDNRAFLEVPEGFFVEGGECSTVHLLYLFRSRIHRALSNPPTRVGADGERRRTFLSVKTCVGRRHAREAAVPVRVQRCAP